MSQLLNKSETNFSSAELLHEKSLFASVAHSSYYGCYQLIKHVWLYTMRKSEADLKTIIDKSQKDRVAEKGSHNVLINEVMKHIRSNNPDDSRVIHTSIGQLKRLRTSADYMDEEFSYEQSSKAIDLSDRIKPLLKKIIIL